MSGHIRKYITGKQAKAARILAGLTQSELAEKTGLCRGAISYVETRHRIEKRDSVTRIIEALRKEGVELQLEPFELSLVAA